MYSWSDDQIYEMPFLRVWTCYNLAVFEEEKKHNESRFAPAWITYFLKAMLGGKDDKVTYESWSEGLGIIPWDKKVRLKPLSKKEEIAKANTNADFVLNYDWEAAPEKVSLNSKPKITRQ